jgi:predicted nucleic acid-binding protein
MPLAFLDASALAKRYALELGTPSVNYLFSRVPADRLAVLAVGLAEVAFVLVRRRHAGRLSDAEYHRAMHDFSTEVCTPPSVRRVPADDLLARAAFPLIESHSINSTDAMVLRAALDLAATLRPSGDDLFLVASDLRLLRAAQAEGLKTFNPETQSPADLDTLLGP